MKSYFVFSGGLPDDGIQLMAYIAQQQEVTIKLAKDITTDLFFDSLNKMLTVYGFSDRDTKSLMGRIRLIERLSVRGEHLLIEFSIAAVDPKSTHTLKYGKSRYPFIFHIAEDEEPSLVFKLDKGETLPANLEKELDRLGIDSKVEMLKKHNPKSIVQDLMFKNDAFSQKLGMKINNVGLGCATVTLKVRKDMTNGFGILHGGVVFSLADSAFAFASNTHGRMAVSIESNISIHQSSNVGDILSASAKEIHVNPKLGKYEVSITNQKSELVATFSGTVYRKSKEWDAL